jgi:hypothetical protein
MSRHLRNFPKTMLGTDRDSSATQVDRAMCGKVSA